MADKSDLDCGDSTFQAAGQVIMSTVHACIVCIHVACVLLWINVSSQEWLYMCSIVIMHPTCNSVYWDSITIYLVPTEMDWVVLSAAQLKLQLDNFLSLSVGAWLTAFCISSYIRMCMNPSTTCFCPCMFWHGSCQFDLAQSQLHEERCFTDVGLIFGILLPVRS